MPLTPCEKCVFWTPPNHVENEKALCDRHPQEVELSPSLVGCGVGEPKDAPPLPLHVHELPDFALLSGRARARLLRYVGSATDAEAWLFSLAPDDIRAWSNCGEVTSREIWHWIEFLKAGEPKDTRHPQDIQIEESTVAELHERQAYEALARACAEKHELADDVSQMSHN